jgi:hypothetical protein
MRAVSFISAVVMLASSASASNDPRECEGECLRVRPMPSMAMRDEILLQTIIYIYLTVLLVLPLFLSQLN